MWILRNSLAAGGLTLFFCTPVIGMIADSTFSTSLVWWLVGGSLGSILAAGAIAPFCDED